MEEAIKVSNLNAYFGNTQALKDINISIKEKMVTAIIGPSGCGKSTFIRCINRLHEVVPNTKVFGEVLLDGKDIYSTDIDPIELRRRVGMVFQRPNPFPVLSIYDNVAAGLKLNGMKRRDDLDEIVEKSLRMAALWDEVKDKLNASGVSLSGGQQQRLCIARAVAVKPEVILFDEPCASLDPISTAKIEELIMELKKDYTIVIVTHNMQQASRTSDYTAFFLMGEIIELGKTPDIFTKPQNTKTEAYITGRFG
ncbi:MAG: phosphate ABC transporter ATP-binding protein PstB [Candidatus Omnitrophota bacterium]|jgi:phosphate transport system ATP-binding protein